jgi:hypothetical protein
MRVRAKEANIVELSHNDNKENEDRRGGQIFDLLTSKKNKKQMLSFFLHNCVTGKNLVLLTAGSGLQ